MEKTNWEWVDINKLKIDNENPNRMTKQEKLALWTNIVKFGWNMPIITDMSYLIADGEQKYIVAKEHGAKEVPVLRKKITDIERRIIRQSMNKLRGTHDEGLDENEYKMILSQISMEEFVGFTAISEQNILNVLNKQMNDAENIKKVNEVDKLYTQEVTCPKCGHVFKKKTK